MDSFSSGSTSYSACTCQDPIGAGHIWATLSHGSINVGRTGKIMQDLKQQLSSIMKHFLVQLMTIKCSNMSLKMEDHMLIFCILHESINPRLKTGVCEYLESPSPIWIFNLEALNGLISYVVYSLGYI